MSTAVFSTPAAQGRLFSLDSDAAPESDVAPPSRRLSGGRPRPLGDQERFPQTQLVIGNLAVIPASRLAARPAPDMAASGIAAIDALTGGLPRGCLTEICGPASSGRTTVLLAAMAAATRRGECCVVVDASDALDPLSAAAAGVALDRLLWVRCEENSQQRHKGSPQRHRVTEKSRNQKEGISSHAGFHLERKISRASEYCLEQVLRATDLLLESGGFGLIVLDLADVPQQAARRIPLTTWFRFRRAVEHTPTILLAVEEHPIAGSCSSLLLKLGSSNQKLAALEEAAKRRKNAAHGASRGFETSDDEAPEGRNNTRLFDPSTVSQSMTSAHTQLLTGFEITAELTCSRLERNLDRKPSASVNFATKTAWAG